MGKLYIYICFSCGGGLRVYICLLWLSVEQNTDLIKVKQHVPVHHFKKKLKIHQHLKYRYFTSMIWMEGLNQKKKTIWG